MPTRPTPGGGRQWGHSGKVYKGKGAKKKADAQGKAAYANGWRDVPKKRAGKT